jgi:hypothetical protein
VSIDSFHQINQAIVEQLDSKEPSQQVTLLIDITRPGKVPQAFAQLKESQTYLHRRDLKFIIVAGNDKFMRLMMLLTFNLGRPILRFFDNFDQGLKFAQKMSSSSLRGEAAYENTPLH